MNTQQAYNNWASQYDTNRNRTRDLEAIALKDALCSIPFSKCLEIGCGTGKNTQWLLTKAQNITAVDLSENMLAHAKEKIKSDAVQFYQADILNEWSFAPPAAFHLVTFSLVLEHIEELEPMLQKAASALQTGGYVYIGELHPYKQYGGTKARFDTENGTQEVPCFLHHISEFTDAGRKAGFVIQALREYFDENETSGTPRILTLVLQKR